MTLHRTSEPELTAPRRSRARGAAADVDARASTGLSTKVSLSLAGLGLVYLVIAHSFVAYLAEAVPERALRLAPHDPVALVSATERTFSRPPAKDTPVEAQASDMTQLTRIKPRLPSAPAIGIEAELEPEQVRDLRSRVEQALAAEPLSARAIRVLGQLAEMEGDTPRATRLIETAIRRSKHDSLAVLMMIRRSLDAQDWDNALLYTEILMRTRHDMVHAVVPVVVRLLETPAIAPRVKAAIAAQPVWRPAFMQLMFKSLTDARTPLDLFLALKEAGTPPTREDLASYLNFLIGHRLFDVAYYTWLQFLPPELVASIGIVFNGGFEQPVSGMPFDWSLPRPIGSTVEILRVPGETGNRALRIEFQSGRAQLGNIQQRILLAPGTYVLTGRLKGEVAGRRGTRVTVTCAATNAAKIAETPMFTGNAPTWQGFETTFKVPEECGSQLVRIIHDARFSAEQMVKGTVWYDDISIRTAVAESASQPEPTDQR
jgi:hypothetical protein